MSIRSIPQQVVKHPITVALRKLGATEDQLASVQFRANRAGFPFEFWSIFPAMLPPLLGPYLKAYCALKWILVEDPPWSHDRDRAWDYITQVIEGDGLIDIGLKSKEQQRARARKPRVKLDNGQTMAELVSSICVENPGLRARLRRIPRAAFA